METAQDLQKAAADTVFNGQWGIPSSDVIACTEPQAHVRAAHFAAWRSPL